MNEHPPSRPIQHPLWALSGRFPACEAWTGVSGIFYARRRRHSPALVLQAETVEALAAKLTEWEASR